MGSTPFEKRLYAAIVLAALSVLVSDVIAQILPLNPSRYRIISAPEFPTGGGGSARAFEWVDNDRLLFLVNDRQLSQVEQRERRTVITKAVPTIHIWDFRAGTIKRYRDEPLADYLCVSDGRVYYGLRRNGKKVTFEGAFEQEREQPEPPLRTDNNGYPLPRGFNRLACKRYWYADLPRPHGGRAMPLREEHGILERTGSIPSTVRAASGSEPFKWWNNLGERSTEVPFPQEWIVGPIEYSRLASAYLFWREVNHLERGAVNRFYLWMPRSNGIRKLDVLGSENWTALLQPVLTKAGLVAKSSTPTKNKRAKWDVGPAGIYLFSGLPVEEFINGYTASNDRSPYRPFSVEQIVSGLIEEMSGVSPDGCRVVVVVDPWDAEIRRFRFEVIDFCAKGG